MSIDAAAHRRVVLVTGTTGIGRASAGKFIQQGAVFVALGIDRTANATPSGGSPIARAGGATSIELDPSRSTRIDLRIACTEAIGRTSPQGPDRRV